MDIGGAQPQSCRDGMASESRWRSFTLRSTMPARISPPTDYVRVSTPRWGSLPARPMVSLVNAIRVNESGQEQYQQLLPPPNDSASKAMSTKSPGKKSSFINRSFRKLRMKFKPEPRSDSSSEAVTIAAQQMNTAMVSTPSATDTQVGGGGRPRLVSTAIKTFSSRGRLLGKKAPMTEGKATKGSSAPHVTSARGTIAATRQPGIPASTFSTGCAGGTVASFIPQPSESDSDIVSLQPPPRLPPSAWMGASGSDFGLLPSRWCLSDDDEDDDVAEGCVGQNRAADGGHGDGGARIEDSKAGNGRATDMAVTSPRRCGSWDGGREGAGGSSAVLGEFKEYGEDSSIVTGRNSNNNIGTGNKRTNNMMMVGMSGICDRVDHTSNNSDQLSASFLAIGETVSFSSLCGVDRRNRIDREHCKVFGSPCGGGISDDDGSDDGNDDISRHAGIGREVGGEGIRTPRTSRSPAGSPGLTPLRGRSRRGWWRRRRDSYPTSTH